MKQQARIRLKTTSLLNIPSTYIATPSSLLWWDTTAAAESSQWKWNAFIYFNSATTLPLYNQCTTGNAMGHTRRTVTHRHIHLHVCATCVCGQVKGNRWSLFAHKGTKTINANDDDDVEQDNARSYLPPPCGSISLLLLLLLLMTPRGGQRMNNKPPQTWNALKIHNFQIIFNDFKYTWVEPVAPRQMDHEQRPEA